MPFHSSLYRSGLPGHRGLQQQCSPAHRNTGTCRPETKLCASHHRPNKYTRIWYPHVRRENGGKQGIRRNPPNPVLPRLVIGMTQHICPTTALLRVILRSRLHNCSQENDRKARRVSQKLCLRQRGAYVSLANRRRSALCGWLAAAPGEWQAVLCGSPWVYMALTQAPLGRLGEVRGRLKNLGGGATLQRTSDRNPTHRSGVWSLHLLLPPSPACPDNNNHDWRLQPALLITGVGG